jgi:hypothetical protein
MSDSRVGAEAAIQGGLHRLGYGGADRSSEGA